MSHKKNTNIIEESHEPDPAAEPTTGFKLISLDLIDDPEQPMRGDMSIASVEDLVMSIKQVGIIEPVVVKPVDGRYEIIAGHRRTFAARIAKLGEIPCYVRIANSEQTEMLKIHENLYRVDILPADEAKHFAYLMDKQHLTPIKISQMISKSLSYVMDRLDILNYPDFLKSALDNKQISFSVAREFAHFDDLKQMQTAVYYAMRGGMTQEMARKWVQDFKRQREHPIIGEIAVPNVNSGQQEIVHTATCVYCREGLSLIEAEVVYMHTKCLQQANSQDIQPQIVDQP